MISGWITDEIDNLCNVEYGTRVVQKNDGGTIYPVYGGGGATFFMDTYNREDRLTIARFGMSAKCTRFVKGKFFLNDSGLTLSPKNKSQIGQDFLNYQCLALNDVFYSLAKGSAQKNLDVPAFRKIKLNIPTDINLQRKIVAKLDAIFAEIDKATAAAEANAKNAEALFQSYLSDIFHSENPNFISKRIDEIAEIFSGSGFPVNQQGLLNEEIPFYKVSDMNLVGNERHMISHNNSISRETAKQLGAKIIPAKSIIFPKIGGAIATNKKRILSVPSCVDNNVMAIYPDDKLVNPEFFFHLLSSIVLSSFVNEAALPSIKKSTVEERLVKIPKSLREQERICYLIESLKENSHKLKESYFKKLNSLSLLKQSILRQAFAGELVKE